jgi:hypothetical protein
MFGTVRKHSQPLWIVIIIMVVISFVVYFTPGYDPFENQGGTATEADVELSFARGQVLLEQALNMSQQFGGFLPPNLNAQALAGQGGCIWLGLRRPHAPAAPTQGCLAWNHRQRQHGESASGTNVQ